MVKPVVAFLTQQWGVAPRPHQPSSHIIQY
jgi:hypothetical protein